jgi:hypothetical protein
VAIQFIGPLSPETLGIFALGLAAPLALVLLWLGYILTRWRQREYEVLLSLEQLQGGLPDSERADLLHRFRQAEGVSQYLFPLLIAVVLTTLGGLSTTVAVVENSAAAGGPAQFGAAPAEAPAGVAAAGPDAGPHRTTLTGMFFAFLGASLFIAQMLFRRYAGLDLKPPVYFFASMRVFAAMALAFVVERTLPGEAARLAFVAGFLAGVFPDAALIWLRRHGHKLLGFTPRGDPDRLPLTMLQGCTYAHQARLIEAGIEDAHHLATADLARLVMRTPFDLKLLVDWVDQAVLYAHVGDDATLRALRRVGIRGISDLLALVDDLGDREQAARALSAATRGVVEPGRIEMVCRSAGQDPNKEVVCRFWRDERAVQPRAAMAL